MEYKILVLNMGSTSSKISVFVGEEEVHKLEALHDHRILDGMKSLDEQLAYRRKTIDEALAEAGADLTGLSAVACRGGTFGQVKGGAYIVNDELLYQCKHPNIDHASNYSAIIGYDYANEYGCNAYIYDAVCTDEIPDIARVTGIKEVHRTAFSHTLNTKAVARAQAEKMGIKYEDANIIAVHMGGGASSNLQVGGVIVDSIADDEGGFSLERAGKVATRYIIDMCFSGEYDKKAMKKLTKGGSGVGAYLGTKDMREIAKRIDEGDEEAKLIIDAMAYQFGRDIGSLSTIVCGKVDAIVLTGGCAYTKYLTDEITKRVEHIAPVAVYPGALEMEALAMGISRVLDGAEECHEL